MLQKLFGGYTALFSETENAQVNYVDIPVCNLRAALLRAGHFQRHRLTYNVQSRGLYSRTQQLTLQLSAFTLLRILVLQIPRAQKCRIFL